MNSADFSLKITGDIRNLRMSYIEKRDQMKWDGFWCGLTEGGEYFVLAMCQDKESLEDAVKRALEVVP